MEQRLLGEHGLMLSSIGLGTRTWGLDTDPHEAFEMVEEYREVGGTTIEVVDDPQFREPLRTVGNILQQVQASDLRIVLRSGASPNAEGMPQLPSRGVLLDSLDYSLKELQVDHVDLWLLHGPRGQVPLEELLSAAKQALSLGKAHYVGLGGLSWWDAGSAVTAAKLSNWGIAAWSEPVSILEARLLSHESLPLRRSGLGIIAGSPLAGGVLTGKYRHSTPPDARATSPRFAAEFARYFEPSPRSIVEATCRAADGLERSAAQVALAWARDEPGVTSAIVGPRNVRQLQHLLEIDGWRLPRALRDVLAEVAARP